MMIGNIKIELEELLSSPAPEIPKYYNPYANLSYDCEDCKKIIMHDAWHIWHNNDHIETEKQLVDPVTLLNCGGHNA